MKSLLDLEDGVNYRELVKRAMANGLLSKSAPASISASSAAKKPTVRWRLPALTYKRKKHFDSRAYNRAYQRTDKWRTYHAEYMRRWRAARLQRDDLKQPAPPIDNLPVASNGRKMIVQVGQPLVASNRRSEVATPEVGG